MKDRAVQGRGRVGFRPPLTSVLPVAVVLSLLALVFPSEGKWVFVVVFTILFGVIRLRQLLVLTDDHLEVTVFRTRRIPWAQVQGFEAGQPSAAGRRSRPRQGSSTRSLPAPGGEAPPRRPTWRPSDERPTPGPETAVLSGRGGLTGLWTME